MRQAERMANVAVASMIDAKERVRHLSVQTRIWRNLAVIHAHHPDLAGGSVMWMALHGTLVGDIDQLETLEPRLRKQAQCCGRTIGVFADKGQLCEGLSSNDLWPIKRVEGLKQP